MGGRVTSKQDLLPGGFIIHEVGGAIMGSDPKSSVVNQWGQSWDVKNLFLTDGAPFAVQRRQEPDLDHHGARLAQRRLHAGRDEAEGAVTWNRSTIRCVSIVARPSSGCSLQARLCSCLRPAFAQDTAKSVSGYGKDPNLLKIHRIGELWPLTLNRDSSARRRRC